MAAPNAKKMNKWAKRFQNPTSIQDAIARRATACARIQEINIQLGSKHPRREDGTKVKKATTDCQEWKSRANAIKKETETELRFLNYWISQEQQHANSASKKP